MTESRFEDYVRRYGRESWELDALDPGEFRRLIQVRLDAIRDLGQWDTDLRRREPVRGKLSALAAGWQDDEEQSIGWE